MIAQMLSTSQAQMKERGRLMLADDWLSRAIYHLSGWGEWRRTGGGEIGRGYDHRSSVFSSGGGSTVGAFEHLVRIEDHKAAARCDAIIRDDSFTDLYRTALESEYVMQGVIKSNRYVTAELLLDAQRAFWFKAKRWLV